LKKSIEQERVEESIKNQSPSNWIYPKILVFIPMERTMIYPELILPPIVSVARQGLPFVWTSYARTDQARNEAAFKLLESDFTHILMLDSDHVHPRDIIQRLGRWPMLDMDIQIVGGLNFMRKPPYKPLVYTAGKDDDTLTVPATWPKKGLWEVERIGTGSILINRRVFETIDSPWFKYEDDPVNHRYQSEDIYFSKLARESGYKIWCDPTCVSPHLSTLLVDGETFKQWHAVNGFKQENGQLVDNLSTGS
jgi:hypothetical protein